MYNIKREKIIYFHVKRGCKIGGISCGIRHREVLPDNHLGVFVWPFMAFAGKGESGSSSAALLISPSSTSSRYGGSLSFMLKFNGTIFVR